ncbi:MAG TPA: histidine phosphatase family protein [Trebonia sp.]|nr:histidine phosphatase family protein [Trebonia sp.]
MSEVKRLVLLRHGQTTWNLEARFQGHTDIPLDEAGLAQAGRAGRMLAALRPDAIVTSDLGRAISTAQPLARLTGLVTSIDKDLRERSGGLWEGLTDEEIRTRYPSEFKTWDPPEGESKQAVADRVAVALRRAADALPPGGLAVVVSHGAALRFGAEELLGIPVSAGGLLGPLSNCSWSVMQLRRERWRLLEHNAGTLPEPVIGDDR